MNPGYEVPLAPAKFTWKVSPPKLPPGKQAAAAATPPAQAETGAPVYVVDEHGRLTHAGTVAYGLELELTEFLTIGGKIVYAIPRAMVTGTPVSVGKDAGPFWINGTFITAAGLRAPAQ